MKANKEALREKTLRRLRQQSESSRQKKSLIISRRLLRTRLYRQAKRLLCFASIDGEVQTRTILEQALSDGKKVFVPVVTDKVLRHMVVAEVKDLEKDLAHKGHFGIPHPLRLSSKEIPLGSLDLILVPAIAFDRLGNRLGRGGGYFDRFLERVPAGVPRVGLAFKFQVVDRLPSEGHDQPVSRVITE